MERFEHLSMVSFLILGLAIVRFMTSWGSLLARNIISHDLEEEEKQIKKKSKSEMISRKLDGFKKGNKTRHLARASFYWVHSLLLFMIFFTMIIFWWNAYPLNDVQFMPDEKWNLFVYLLFLCGPFLFFLICDVIMPFNVEDIDIDLKSYYYKHSKLIIGLIILLQFSFLTNLLVFFKEDITSAKCIGRIFLIILFTPLYFTKNTRLHSSIMCIFFIGFIYTIIKYHIYA